MRTIVLDRDGLLNVNSNDPLSPHYYILHKEDLILKPGVKDAIARLAGRTVVLATRQRCIAKGLVTIEQVTEINEYLEQLLGFKFTEVFVQPDGEDKSDIFQAIVAKYGKCVLIDDSEKECAAASLCGMEVICSAYLPHAVEVLLNGAQ